MKRSSAITLEEIERFVHEAGSDHVPTFGGTFEGGIQLQQIADEIAPCLLRILESGEKIDAYLEIGAAAGGTTALFYHYFKPVSVVLIDDNGHPKHHVRPYILDGIEHTEIIGHSQALGTVAVLESLGIAFDIVLIDGDHSYPGVSKDVALYRRFLRPGGFLILHDTAMPEWGPMQVVKDLMDDGGMEFVAEYKTASGLRPLGVALFRKVGGE